MKNQVKQTLEKAQEKKQHFETGNQQLKAFIKRIRDFLMGTLMHRDWDWPLAGQVADITWTRSFVSLFCLEEGADPASIEKVAQRVLAIALPVPRTTLEKMILQIKASLSNITNAEGIVNHSSQHITAAKELLGQAEDAKYVSKRTLQPFPSSYLNFLSIMQHLT